MAWKIIAAVASGGAFGAVARYALMSAIGVMRGGFPLSTLVVNVAGSFILGALIEYMALRWSPSAEMRALLVVGVLGSFTTFSTFSLDTYSLLVNRAVGEAFIYILLSVVLSVTAFFAGLLVFRQILT